MAITVVVAVKPVKAVTVEMADAKAAEGEPVAAETMETTETTEAVETTEAMETAEAVETTETMATTTTVASAAAGVGDLGQRYDHRDKHGRHQTEKFTNSRHTPIAYGSSLSTVAIDVLR